MLPKPMPSLEYVVVTIAGQAWKRVESFDNASPDDRVFTVNPELSIVSFGDGVRGSRPPAGAAVEATYRMGEHALAVSWTVPDPSLKKTSLVSVKVLSNSLQFSQYHDVETSWRWKLMMWLCEMLKM